MRSERFLMDGQHPEIIRDWNRVEGNWKQTKGKKEKWGQLTDEINIRQMRTTVISGANVAASC